MPNRIILEQARSSPTLQALTDAEERAWWRLTTACDDYGRFNADPEVLLSELFKRKPAGWTPRKMAVALEGWERAELVHRYTTEDAAPRVYGHVLTFRIHQRERDSRPKFPDPPCASLPSQAHRCLESIEKARQLADCGGSPQLAARARRSRSRSSGLSSLNGGGAGGGSPEGGGATPAWPSPAALVALYNAETPDESPAVATLSLARRRKAQEYLALFPDEAWWREVFRQMHRSPFLRGQVKPRDGRKPFVADFDWLLAKGKDGTENAVKVHDGRYRDG